MTISQNVLSEIAITEAAATEGVVLEHGPNAKGRSLEDVAVRLEGQEAVFHLRIGVRHGLSMPEVAETLRGRIAEAVRAKTGYGVRSVDVVVNRVVREPAAPAES
ncbi:MAG: Asp23/Gls24 family envelope stress response protein [bacterium]